MAPRLSFIEPANPVLVKTPPNGAGWIHEIKQDGFRTQLIIEGERVTAYSRSGIDWTERYPAIVAVARSLTVTSAIIDGEVIVPDEKGASDFHSLARSIERDPSALVFVAFDLMHLNGADLRSRPLSERRHHLEELLTAADTPKLVFSRAFEGDGADVFKAVEQLGLEGIVSKRADGMYRSGTKVGWVKVKSFAVDTYDVIGVDKAPGGAPVALLAKNGVYIGQAFIGLSSGLRDAFWRFIALRTIAVAPITGLRRKGATWISARHGPKAKRLRGEAMLRHASVVEITVPKERRSVSAAVGKRTSARPVKRSPEH